MAAFPAWVWMWTIAALVFAACKWLTWREAPAGAGWREAAYLLAWPGLDAPRFLTRGIHPERVRPGEWIAASGCVAAGALLFFRAAGAVAAEDAYVTGWIGMVGLVLMLHFGAFHLLSCAWRAAGVAARPLMDRPLAAASLADFWGRRWNTAFRDLTHRFLFRPLAARLGSRWGVVAGFVFSGAVHDLVISLPAGGGYGGPSAYFAMQGAGMLFERSAAGRRLGLGHRWRGWLFTMAVLAAPVQLLFHRPFVVGVVVPFMRALGAIS
jgi:hypothetical protein